MSEKKSYKVSLPVLCTAVLILFAATMFSCGCVNKILQKNTDDPDQASNISPADIPVTGGITPLSNRIASPVQQLPVAAMTPVKSEVVTEVAPILTPDPYPVLHGMRINSTPQYNRLDRGIEFEKTYSLSGYATGLLVNVVEGPLYIVYEVTPKFDCLASPDSCRGDMKSPVTRPYMTITVRDNQTREIVAEDGYAREFSSDTGRYEFVIESKNADDSTTTTRTTPGPRYLTIFREGVYHITIEGNYLDMDVKILTGALPSKLDIETGSGSTPAPAEIPPEEERW